MGRWFIKAFSVLCLISIVFSLNHRDAWAYELAATGSATVTATIPDNNPPSTPILISPSNGAELTDSTPEFIWAETTDDRQMNSYQLYLDGSLLYDNIPLTATDNSSYTLTYDSETGYYHLTPKSSIGDGSHTWKIRAVDVLDSYAESVTWSFTIDTQSPVFIITHIGVSTSTSSSTEYELDPHISSQDFDSLPFEPLEFIENELLLIGTGEANSTVELTATIPGDPTQTFDFSIDSDGNWQQQLGILPRGVIITLDFVVTDEVGHITILENIEIYLTPLEIVVSPLFTTPTPTTLPSGEITTPSLEEEQKVSTASGVLILPYLPPKELIHEIIQELEEKIPQPLSTLTASVATETRRLLARGYTWLSPWLALILALTLPITTLLLVSSKFAAPLSPRTLKKVAQALGLFPGGPAQGIFFDDSNNQGVAFGKVSIISQDQNHAFQDVAICDENGIYRGLSVPEGEYRLSPSEDSVIFPTTKVSIQNNPDYYQGAVFKVLNANILPVFLIPGTIYQEQKTQSILESLRVSLARLNRYPLPFLCVLTLVSLFISLLYPFASNWIVVIGYVIIWGKRGYELRSQKILKGIVIDSETHAIPGVIIRAQPLDTQEIGTIFISSKTGQFQLKIKSAERVSPFSLTVSHVSYHWMESAQEGNTLIINQESLNQQKTSSDDWELVLVLKKVS